MTNTKQSSMHDVSVMKESSVINVSTSNQDIVDNIGQISAVCEEITASTENAAAISNGSKQLAQKAVMLLDEVLEVSHKLDKYKD